MDGTDSARRRPGVPKQDAEERKGSSLLGHNFMEIALIILAFALLAAGLLGAVVPLVPGPPLSFAGLLALYFSGRGSFLPVYLAVWGCVAVGAMLMDFFLPSLMTKRFGGSRFASIGSFFGLLIGIIFFSPYGVILGPFLGALAGEFLHRRGVSSDAFKAALGAFLSFIVGAGVKLTVSILMLTFAIGILAGG